VCLAYFVNLQGVFGTLLIRLNIRIAKFRLKPGSVLGEWPILEVIGGSAFTAVFCYLVRLLYNLPSHAYLTTSGRLCASANI